MSIPKHYELRIPVLEYLKQNGPSSPKDMVKPIGLRLNLSDDDMNEMYASGNGPVFHDRIKWAITSLSLSGVIIKLRRGVYEIGPIGIELLTKPAELDSYIDKQLAIRDAAKTSKTITNTTDLPVEKFESLEKLTPQEKLYQSYANIKKSTCDEILDAILSKTPREFEKLVVTLLQKMGYGGEIKNSGIVTQATNDNGIDGIIKEDVLGLGRIYIQAKRYAPENTIGREEIQKFVGALAVAQSNKGVFITTSYFKKTATEYVNSLNGSTTIVLIDGQQLADYIYDYELGMKVEQIIKIKKLDSDFWDAMQDD